MNFRTTLLASGPPAESLRYTASRSLYYPPGSATPYHSVLLVFVITMTYSPPRRGGEYATSIKIREASFAGADGVVSPARPYSQAELTTPSAPLRWLRSIGLMAQPPLHCEEGNVRYSTMRHCNYEPPSTYS